MKKANVISCSIVIIGLLMMKPLTLEEIRDALIDLKTRRVKLCNGNKIFDKIFFLENKPPR